MKRTVFYLSDRTGITAEMLGHSLLTQFEGIDFQQITLPYIDSVDKAEEAVHRINKAAAVDGFRPLLFSTLVDMEVREIISESKGMMLDFFDTFIDPLEKELHIHSSTIIGRSHGIGAYDSYKARIDAVNFALSNDDGVSVRNYPSADIILLGVSRSGKTPTCLYLALQYGLLAANFPLTEDDLSTSYLPVALDPYRNKLFGLTIDPVRLQQIRQERRSDSRYASAQQCQFEVKKVEQIYRRENIPFIDTSSASIEEIATTILHKTGLQRRRHG
ncbi:MAG: pyruvate, water dikinase regulatory protein [Gammaproteobacteria bacterium]|jgi:regulator of PEP synthase PpsR (kinase-PPPase family)